jgi:hypothetical protein
LDFTFHSTKPIGIGDNLSKSSGNWREDEIGHGLERMLGGLKRVMDMISLEIFRLQSDVIFFKQKYINNKIPLAIGRILVGQGYIEGVKLQGVHGNCY